jgi:hypothetical protein
VRIIHRILVAALVAFAGVAPAGAATIALSPGALTGKVGDLLVFDVLGEDFGGATVGGFAVIYQFDPALLAFQDFVLGTALGDARSGEVRAGAIPRPGQISIGVASLLGDAELALLQTSAILTFGQLVVRSLATGSAMLAPIGVAVVDVAGDPVIATGESSSVAIGAVPEPASIVLLGSCLALAATRRRPHR